MKLTIELTDAEYEFLTQMLVYEGRNRESEYGWGRPRATTPTIGIQDDILHALREAHGAWMRGAAA